MITVELLDTRYVELSDELRRVEGSIRENRQMREWLAKEKLKEAEMACKGGKGKGSKGK